MNWFKRLIGPKPFVPEPVIDERFVRTTLDELDLSSLYDRVMDAARPCVRFFRGSISDEPLETPGCQYGGAPYLQAETPWPIDDKTGVHLPFVCQFDLEEIAETLALADWPHAGFLSFFADIGPPERAVYEQQQGSFRSIPIDIDAKLRYRARRLTPYAALSFSEDFVDQFELSESVAEELSARLWTDGVCLQPSTRSVCEWDPAIRSRGDARLGRSASDGRGARDALGRRRHLLCMVNEG